MEEITKIKDQNRTSKEWSNHLTTVAEGAPFVGWITVVCQTAHSTPSQSFNFTLGDKTPRFRIGYQRYGAVLLKPCY
jgi:hypothetical protein